MVAVRHERKLCAMNSRCSCNEVEAAWLTTPGASTNAYASSSVVNLVVNLVANFVVNSFMNFASSSAWDEAQLMAPRHHSWRQGTVHGARAQLMTRHGGWHRVTTAVRVGEERLRL